MATLTTILSTAERALGILRMLEPVLGDGSPVVGKVLEVVAKALDGARAGSKAYAALLDELDGVVSDLESIRERGGVTGGDFRAEAAAIAARGDNIDAILARLKG
jgi:hypothetical protein